MTKTEPTDSWFRGFFEAAPDATVGVKSWAIPPASCPRSHRRRAEPSPLSSRETTVLRLLAQGKVYKEIAHELGVSASTIRTHLHNCYEKLHVADRAHAVLRVTEMGWI